MKTQLVKMAFSCKAFLQKRRLSLVLFPKLLKEYTVEIEECVNNSAAKT